MPYLIGGLLAAFSIAILIYPFIRRRHLLSAEIREDSSGGDAELAGLYESIRTLQLEHQLGNIAQQVYEEQLRGYRLQAAQFLRREARGQTEAAEWLLEQEVLNARGDLQSSDGTMGLARPSVVEDTGDAQ